MPSKAEYVPGTCNIGEPEIKLRKRVGWLGLGATLILWFVLYVLPVSAAWRFLVFIPATISAIGILQARMHFCVAFGLLGVFNFRSAIGPTDAIKEIEYKRKDRRKAILITFYAIMVGSIVAAVGYLL